MPTGEQDVETEPSAEAATAPELAVVLTFPTLGRPAPSQPDLQLRDLIGAVLRDERHAQQRTLADVAADAAVSLAYLSEIERGRKEVSSDLLDAVGGALELPLVDILERCAERLRTRMQGGSGVQLRAA
jgi:hypothetical protein